MLPADRPTSERSGYRPWLQRRIDASRGTPVRAGLTIAAATLFAFFAGHALG